MRRGVHQGRPTGGARTLTAPVLASALFTAAAAVFAITFVAARGGLQMPIAATLPPVAEASASLVPSSAPAASASPAPDPSGAPTTPPTVAPTAGPTPTSIVPPPTAEPSFARPTIAPDDPLLALEPCAGHPGCFEYVVQRFDTLSGIITRYRLDYDVL